MKKLIYFLFFVLIILSAVFIIVFLNNHTSKTSNDSSIDATKNDNTYSKSQAISKKEENTTTARIVANGDLLYHDILYMSARTGDSYDFSKNYEYVKDFISKADLAIADYEGTINPEWPLSGYPLFNAPPELVNFIKDAGYDCVTLAHNHILDSGIDGIKSTAKYFNDVGIDIFGVSPNKPRSENDILIKEVNGIKIALLSYCYGFNGIEATISEKDYNDYLYDLNEEKIKAEIERAEKIADITIVFPHMGVEYMLTPTDEQVKLYDNMVKWGADIILGGHPHVAQPTKTIDINDEKKFIIYSMGNFISNQRIETIDNKWSERGVLVDLTIEKNNNKTTISAIKLHPTWVSKTSKGIRGPEGFELFDYSTLICEDVINNREKYSFITENNFNRIKSAYNELNELLNLDPIWK